MLALEPGWTSGIYNSWSNTWLHVQKGSALGLGLCCHCIKTLENSIFELTFGKWASVGQWSQFRNGGDPSIVCVCCSLLSICIYHLWCPWAQNFFHAQDVGIPCDSNQVLDSIVHARLSEEGGPDSSQDHVTSYTKTCFQNRNKSNGVLRSMNHQETLPYPFLPSLIPLCEPCEHDDIKGNGNIGQLDFFPF